MPAAGSRGGAAAPPRSDEAAARPPLKLRRCVATVMLPPEDWLPPCPGERGALGGDSCAMPAPMDDTRRTARPLLPDRRRPKLSAGPPESPLPLLPRGDSGGDGSADPGADAVAPPAKARPPRSSAAAAAAACSARGSGDDGMVPWRGCVVAAGRTDASAARARLRPPGGSMPPDAAARRPAAGDAGGSGEESQPPEDEALDGGGGGGLGRGAASSSNRGLRCGSNTLCACSCGGAGEPGCDAA